MEIRLSPGQHFGQAELESLHDWLQAEPELGGRVRVVRHQPGGGEMGALGDALVVAVGAQGTLSVLALSLKAWLSQPRRSDVRIRVENGDGRVVEIDAHNVLTGKDSTETLVDRILGSKSSEG